MTQVLRHNPDIIGTQEGFLQQIQELREKLYEHERNYTACGCPRERILGMIPCGETCSVLSHWPRVKCLEQDSFALSETFSKIGSTSWGTACPRIATYAWLAVDTGDHQKGYCLLLLNTHLDHRRVIRSRSLIRAVQHLHFLDMGVSKSMGPPYIPPNSTIFLYSWDVYRRHLLFGSHMSTRIQRRQVRHSPN